MKCRVCALLVPPHRLNLRLCNKHAKHFNSLNWSRVAQGIWPIPVDVWANTFRPKWMKKSEEEYRESNRLQTRQWYWRDPQHARQVRTSYYKRNRPLELSRAKSYRQRNPDKIRLFNTIYNKRNRMAVGVCTEQQWLWRVEFYGWHCVYCAKILTESTLTIDHRIPLARGGTNWPANLLPACKPCNSRKGARWVA